MLRLAGHPYYGLGPFQLDTELPRFGRSDSWFSPPPHLTPLRAPFPRRPPAPPHLPSAPRGGPPGVAEPSLLPGGSRRARCLPPALRYRRDQVPPLLPLQLWPPPPPPCMTQQNRSCCSESQPSAQEAPQPGLGRGKGGRGGGHRRGRGGGFLPPLCTTQSFPSLGAWAQNKAKADQAEPLRNAGVWRQKGWDQRGGCEGDPSWGRTLQVKKGKKRPRSQGPGREGE